MDLHARPPTLLDPMPTVTRARLVVDYADGTTSTLDVPAATSASFGVEVDAPAEIRSSNPLRITCERRSLVIRFADADTCTATIPATD